MQAKVTIGFKTGVLDPEARAIQRSLQGLGFAEVEGLRKYKVIELDLAMTDKDAAAARVQAMCEKLLANPVIESYTVELVN
jgi:phosphoribosylformylglycinamidine synthase subunit PurS